MERAWSFLFLLVPVFGIAIVVGAATQTGWNNAWLPESIGPRTEGIDWLFNLIHVILGIVFLGTGLVLAYSLWRFRATPGSQSSPTSGNTKLEVVWAVIPAGILIFLAMYQLPYWQANKELHPLFVSHEARISDNFLPPIAQVVAFQYGWRFVYPGEDRYFGTRDDLISENLLVLPSNEEVVLEMVSKDVIHSFSVTQLRLKQDIVPGLSPRVWFKITENGEWTINCMELCGWGHYRMNARLKTVPRDEFDRWKQQQISNRGF